MRNLVALFGTRTFLPAVGISNNRDRQRQIDLLVDTVVNGRDIRYFHLGFPLVRSITNAIRRKSSVQVISRPIKFTDNTRPNNYNVTPFVI